MRTSTIRAALFSAAIPSLAGLGALVPLGVAEAQEVRILRSPGQVEVLRGTSVANRPMIGVTVSGESERADTLGLRIEEVSEGSPAARAGLKAGDRLQAVNGVSLRANRNDAGQDDYDGVLARRLQREIGKVQAGDTVRLQVLSEGRSRDVRVATMSPQDLYRGENGVLRRSAGGDRLVLGLTTSPSGNARDTLGVFVSAVTDDGPAAKAGIVEGDRIAAINGVSLRVAREDAGDTQVAQAKANRLRSEMEKVQAGQSVELTVVSAGRSRTVRVTPVKASELPGGAGTYFFSTSPDDIREALGRARLLRPGVPTPPTPPTPPAASTRARTIIRDLRVL